MTMFRILALCLAAWLGCFALTGAAQARAHCYCKIGPIGAPYHNFGEIASYKTQIGHDSDCRNSCVSTVNSYLSNAANKAAMCTAASNGSVISYSAVGTRPYAVASTTTCPAAPGGPPGSLTFNAWTTQKAITINGVAVNPYAPPSVVSVPGNNTPFTIFELADKLKFHAQKWTYTAKLYRDGVLIEQLARKSPPASNMGLRAIFTGQPNAFVHGHSWKIEWHYAGPNHQNGSATFTIP